MSSGEVEVQCATLPKWLLARQVVPEDYWQQLPAVEAKVEQALAEQVTDEATKSLIAQHKGAVTYFAARDIYKAIAKSPEGKAKTETGSHASPAAAKWKAVMDAYDGNRLGWASEARLLVQNANYEIPALKKTLAACERQISECTQRQSELTSAEANAKTRYEALLKEFNIDGQDPRGELQAFVAAELPKVYAEIQELLKSSGAALAEYFEAFAQHAAGDSASSLVPLWRTLASDGDEARIADVEQRVPALRALRESAAKTAASAAPASDSSLLADASARELLYQEVTEMDAFLRERCAELAAGRVDGGPLNAEKGVQEVEAFAAVTARAEELLASRRTQRLFLLRSSERYLDQAVARVDQAKAQCSKPGVQRSALDKVKAEQAEDAERSRAEIEDLRQATKKVQQALEAELSTHFKSKIRIVGEISQI